MQTVGLPNTSFTVFFSGDIKKQKKALNKKKALKMTS